MEFLVRMDIELPGALAPEEVDALVAAERVRGRQLRGDGHLVRIWRVSPTGTPNPRSLKNVGVWAADDRGHLDAVLASLPLWPYVTASVTPLETHPLEQ